MDDDIQLNFATPPPPTHTPRNGGKKRKRDHKSQKASDIAQERANGVKSTQKPRKSPSMMQRSSRPKTQPHRAKVPEAPKADAPGPTKPARGPRPAKRQKVESGPPKPAPAPFVAKVRAQPARASHAQRDFGSQSFAKKIPKVQAVEGKPDLPSVSTPAPSEAFSHTTFKAMGLADRIYNQLTGDMGLKDPTHVQARAIPALLQNRDVLVKSQTGSGKTLAYLIPMVQKLQMKSVDRAQGTKALILAPTRELSVQIFTVLELLLRAYHWMVAGVIMGGERKKSEKQRLRKGCTVIVATPGRCLDHLTTTKAWKVDELEWLVLDEADRLLDLGFEKDVRRIISIVRERSRTRRQNALVSATLDSRVSRLANFLLKNPISINVNAQDGTATTSTSQSSAARSANADSSTGGGKHNKDDDFHIPDTLDQYYVEVPSATRLVSLASLLRSRIKARASSKILVFMSTCNEVEFHYALLSRSYWPMESSPGNVDDDAPPLINSKMFRLHGNMGQQERTATYLDFCKSSGVLLCTDVAARGLDLPAVDWVVQYDPPAEVSEYVHRAGRTARLGRSGSSVLFLLESEKGYLDVINKMIAKHTRNADDAEAPKKKSKKLKKLNAASLFRCLATAKSAEDLRHAPKYGKGHPFSFDRRPENMLQTQFFDLIEEDYELKEIASRAFQSFVRAYATYPRTVKQIFHVNNLHLGHVAKSFGLKEAPSRVAAVANYPKKSDKLQRPMRGYNDKRPHFGSGSSSQSSRNRPSTDDMTAPRLARPRYDNPKHQKSGGMMVSKGVHGRGKGAPTGLRDVLQIRSVGIESYASVSKKRQRDFSLSEFAG